MNIAYVANIKFPTNKAHGFQIARTVSEFNTQEVDAVLYVTAENPHVQETPAHFYDLPKEIDVEYASGVNWLKKRWLPKHIGFLLRGWSALRSIEKAMLRREQSSSNAIVYTRDSFVIKYFKKRGFKVVFNAHGWSNRQAQLVKDADAVVCNSPGTKRAVLASLPEMKTLAVHNATDPNEFLGSDKAKLREGLGLPIEKRVVLYTGHLYDWKGVDVLLDAAKELPDLAVVFVGGVEEDVSHYKKKAKEKGIVNAIFSGYKPKRLMPQYMVAADALVLPNIPITKEAVSYTSPIKLFEYMASGTPIVASDVPSTREILSENEAYIYEAKDPKELAEAVRAALEDRDRAKSALTLSANYTWKAQVATIKHFLGEV